MGKGAGRPAKQGPRYPGGQLKPQPKPQGDPVNPIVLQRLFKDAAKLGVDQRLASQVGRLWCLREFTAQHAAVAFRIAGVYARFERAHGLRRATKSPSYEMGYGRGADGDPDDAKQEEADWNDLQGWMDNFLDWRLRAAVEQLCVEDCAISSLALPKIRTFFDRMAPVLGLAGNAAKAAKKLKTKVKGKPGLPLHFNAHEAGAAETNPEPDKPDGSAPKPPEPKPERNIDRLYWIETMKRLRPDLSNDDLRLAYDFTSALKDRAARERQLERTRPPERVPASQQYPMRLGRPVLTLPAEKKSSE